MGISATGVGLLLRLWNHFVFGVELLELRYVATSQGQFPASPPEQARMDGGINNLSTHVLCSLPPDTHSQNFGLDYDAFQHMVGDCPPDFLQLTFNCCNVSVSSCPQLWSGAGFTWLEP